MFVPLVNFTHYSLQLGFSKPKEIIYKCLEYGYEVCGIADLKSVSGCVEFFKLCKKNGIKPILGISLDKDTHLFAKNIEGWKKLIKIASGGDPADPYGNLICISKDKSFENLFKDFLLNDGSIKPYYYCDEKDRDVHRISVCSGLKITTKDPMPHDYKYLFVQDLCFPECEYGSDMIKYVVDNCEEYDILKAPELPHFNIPGKTESELLKEICRDGWRKKIAPILKTEGQKQNYLERFNHEFSVIETANLFGYFLIIHDIISYANMQGFITGIGRGSVGGSLISYLMNITRIDPIKYNLLFERFYNTSRNTKDYTSLPDIDLDVPSCKRDIVIDYIRNKYTTDRVAQIATFSRLQGRSVLKEVLRIAHNCGFSEMNAITKHIPDEADVSDELQKMKEEERGILKWALINKKSELEPFCVLGEDGKLNGDYAEAFSQALRLEGTFKNMGTHAAGIIISKDPIIETCPVVNGIALMEMESLDSLGIVKIDVLGVSVLSKLMRVRELVS